MLTKPYSGWTDFQLEGTSKYSLSYLDDIAFEWIDQSIHGLETMLPFCVKGFLEPDRMLCTVSFWNCHIVIENDERNPLEKGDIVNEYSHTSMIDFCKYLYNDIISNVDEWASFVDYHDEDIGYKKTQHLQKLERLRNQIQEREECFGENRGFL